MLEIRSGAFIPGFPVLLPPKVPLRVLFLFRWSHDSDSLLITSDRQFLDLSPSVPAPDDPGPAEERASSTGIVFFRVLSLLSTCFPRASFPATRDGNLAGPCGSSSSLSFPQVGRASNRVHSIRLGISCGGSQSNVTLPRGGMGDDDGIDGRVEKRTNEDGERDVRHRT